MNKRLTKEDLQIFSDETRDDLYQDQVATLVAEVRRLQELILDWWDGPDEMAFNPLEAEAEAIYKEKK